MMTTTLWYLLTVQMALGAFDILYHHEFLERLAWRPSQLTELKLHGLRNFSYALLFLVIAWVVPYGFWALLLMLLLMGEVVLTLVDFVEEDRSRLLPWSERVAHAVLALNFGAILILLLPTLFIYSTEPSRLHYHYQGYVSWGLTVCALLVALLGIRDLLAACRLARYSEPEAAGLLTTTTSKRILITGASGLIGSRLVAALSAVGHQVIVLTRNQSNVVHLPAPLTVITQLDQLADDSVIDVVINLAGEPLGNGLWTRRKRERILHSRLDLTQRVIGLISRLQRKPELLINGSAVGCYGLQQDELMTEETVSTDQNCFSQQVCQSWESIAYQATQYGVRVVCLRIGLVLSTQGGLLGQLLPAFEFGLGGPIGNGRQWMSWIERDDLIRLLGHIMATPTLQGAVNAVAPEPVRNEQFSCLLARALNRPALFRLPAAPLRRLGGAFAEELLLGGQRVRPDKALASGFSYNNPRLNDALKALLIEHFKVKQK